MRQLRPDAGPTLAERVDGSPALRRRQAVGRGIGHLLARLDVRGLDNVPAAGPVVLASNHRAFLDGPLLFGVVPRPVTFLVKIEAFNAVTTPILLGAGQVPVVRQRFDPAPVRLCLTILFAGGVVGIFPEGARGDGLARTARPGVGYLALRTGATVVPVACHGTTSMARRRSMARPRVSIVFGRPVAVAGAPRGRRVRRVDVRDVTERIRHELAGLVADTALHDGRQVAA